MIAPEHGPIIQGLLDQKASLNLKLEVSGSFPDTADPSTKDGKVFVQRHCSLFITIYGPFDPFLFKDIGTWLQEHNTYLQDPTYAERQNVRYCNPHRLSVKDLSSCPMISDFLTQSSKPVAIEEMGDQPGFLDILSTHADLPETEQPSAVCTRLERCVPKIDTSKLIISMTYKKLLRHQRQALTFMLNRECGWAFEKDGDIWEVRDTHQELQ